MFNINRVDFDVHSFLSGNITLVKFWSRRADVILNSTVAIEGTRVLSPHHRSNSSFV